MKKQSGLLILSKVHRESFMVRNQKLDIVSDIFTNASQTDAIFKKRKKYKSKDGFRLDFAFENFAGCFLTCVVFSFRLILALRFILYFGSFVFEPFF